MDFSETILIYDSKLATADWSEVSIYIKTVPWGLYAPSSGYMYVLIVKKKSFKSHFKEISLKLVTNR